MSVSGPAGEQWICTSDHADAGLAPVRLCRLFLLLLLLVTARACL